MKSCTSVSRPSSVFLFCPFCDDSKRKSSEVNGVWAWVADRWSGEVSEGKRSEETETRESGCDGLCVVFCRRSLGPARLLCNWVRCLTLKLDLGTTTVSKVLLLWARRLGYRHIIFVISFPWLLCDVHLWFMSRDMCSVVCCHFPYPWLHIFSGFAANWFMWKNDGARLTCASHNFHARQKLAFSSEKVFAFKDEIRAVDSQVRLASAVGA